MSLQDVPGSLMPVIDGSLSIDRYRSTVSKGAEPTVYLLKMFSFGLSLR